MAVLSRDGFTLTRRVVGITSGVGVTISQGSVEEAVKATPARLELALLEPELHGTELLDPEMLTDCGWGSAPFGVPVRLMAEGDKLKETLHAGTNSRMRLLFASATKRLLPARSNVTPTGRFSETLGLEAGPPSAVKAAIPFPTAVLMAPLGVTLLTRLL